MFYIFCENIKTISNDASYFYLLNLQGDVIDIYDSTGTVVVKYIYDAWGKLISTSGSLTSTIGAKNPIRYRSYYYDTETKLYYLQSRYYDPETCRFINADSLIIAGDYLQGTNMFAYCLNNPVMYVDPSGRNPVDLLIPFLEDFFWILLYVSYIEEYAKKNNKDANALFDFLERITKKDTTLVELREKLLVGIYILEGEAWIDAFLSSKSIADDVKDIVNFVLEKALKVDIILVAAEAIFSIIKDYYNPLIYDEEVNLNVPVHLSAAAAGVGVLTFSAELGAAIFAVTGKETLAIAVASGFYLLATGAINLL